MQVGTIDRLVKEKKNLIRELRYKGEEKHGEKREERQRERSMGRGEIRVSDSEGRHQKIMFPTSVDEDTIYRRCNT